MWQVHRWIIFQRVTLTLNTLLLIDFSQKKNLIEMQLIVKLKFTSMGNIMQLLGCNIFILTPNAS